ncbi:MAG: hypothetical protein ACRENJ_12265 [Candidatus Eiseniibacteriota bacterium]
MTERAGRRFPSLDPGLAGALSCAAGFALLGWPSLFAAALGLECFGAGFWTWARAAEDRREQLPRWAWLRRPALALWLAAGLDAVGGGHGFGALAPLSTPVGALARVSSIAVLWGALELMASLPLARPASVRPGPLSAAGPWLPVMLPGAGFLLLWRHADHWTRVPEVRTAAVVLMIASAALAALRAYSRRDWMSSLRWLVIGDCVLAGALVALRAVPDGVALLLWMGAFGGHALLLAGELSGAGVRRGEQPRRLWRFAVWISLASLSLPVIATLGGAAGEADPILALVAAIAVGFASLVSVRRLVSAPDRRTMLRRESAVPLAQVGALGVLVSGPLGLLFSWQGGFEPRAIDALAALIPAAAGGWAAGLVANPLSARQTEWVTTFGKASRYVALVLFHGLLAFEAALRGMLRRIALALGAPARDLHTGDAQEFLLFLVGVAVLAVVLPLLR